MSVGGIVSQSQLAVTESFRKGGGPQGLRLSTSGREAEKELRETLKITQHPMVKRRRSYGSI